MSQSELSPDQYCVATAVEGIVLDNPLSSQQAQVVEAVGIRTQVQGKISTYCPNSLDPEIGCSLAFRGSVVIGGCALGKTIHQAEIPTSVPGVYREPGERVERPD